MRRIIQVIIVAAVTLLPLIPANTAGASAKIDPHQYCNNENVYCWRDPSDGGAGTVVENSTYSTDNSEMWAEIYVYPYYELKNPTSGYCLGSNLADEWVVEMHTCGDEDTLWTRFPIGDEYQYVSADYYNDYGQLGYLTGGPRNGALTVELSCDCGLQSWIKE